MGIERPAEPPPPPEPIDGPAVSPFPVWGQSLIRSTAGLGPGLRIVVGILVAVAFRAFAMLANLAPVGGRGASIVDARLPGLALAFVIVGGVVGGFLARPRGESKWRDTLATTLAGGLFGLLISAVDYAMIRSVELPLAEWSSSVLAVELLWAVIGAALAGISCLLIPYHPARNEAAP